MKHVFHNRDDELHHCKVCGGAEITLPPECPGRKLTEAELDACADGRLMRIWRVTSGGRSMIYDDKPLYDLPDDAVVTEDAMIDADFYATPDFPFA